MRTRPDSVHNWPPLECVATLAGFELEGRTLVTKWEFSTGEQISRLVFKGDPNWTNDLNIILGEQLSGLDLDGLRTELESKIGTKFNIKIRPKVGDDKKNVVNRIRSKV